METIKNYLDNMFSGLPRTEEMAKLKDNIYENMQDKYQELKASGKTENEAIGIVISEFGNIEELMEEFDIAREGNSKYDADIDRKAPKEDLPDVNMDTARNYLKVMKTVGKFVGLGVLLCIIGTAILIAGTALFRNTQAGGQSSLGAGMGLVVMLIFVAGGVALFVYSGILASPYEYIGKPFSMSSYVKQQLEMEWSTIRSSNMVTLVIGICMCIISPIPVIIGNFISQGEGFAVIIGTCMMLVIVACAVYLIIYSGCIMSGYHQLLEIGDYTPAKKKANKVVEVVASIVWPLVTVVYLYIGFVHGMWHPGWVIFPITGVVFGAFAAITEGISGK